MKHFNQFRKDLSEMDRTMTGTGLVGAGLRGLLTVTTKPIRTITSFASTVDDFSKRRKKQIEKRDEQSKLLKKKANQSDVEADKLCADCEKDPDLEKLDRNPPDNDKVVEFKPRNKPKK
jgi:homoserine dehydrogenase